MPFGLPNLSYIGYPISLPCPGHAGLGFREARPGDEAALLAHFRALDPSDLRMRFCGTVGESILARHVTGLCDRVSFALVALDGPLWPTPLAPAGQARGLAEIVIHGDMAELGISVDPGLRQRGVGTYLVQTAGWLLAQRGVSVLRADTLAENSAMLRLARSCGGQVAMEEGEVVVTFPVPELCRAYLRRRLARPVVRRVG